MKFKAIESPVISEDGGWVAYGAQPDRGDGEVKVQSVQSGTSYALERGTAPVFSKDARWVAAAVRPKATDLEEKKDEKDKPRPGLVLLNLITGDTTARTRVDRFAFSENAAWFAYLYFKSDEPAVKDTSIAAKSKKDGKKNVGGDLVLHRLETGREARIPFVLTFAFDSTSRFLAYTVADTSGKLNGLYYRDLRNIDSTQKPILANMNGVYTNLAWNNRTGQLAFVAATVDDKEKPGPGSVWIWESGDARPSEITPSTKAPAGWMAPSKNDLSWSKDGKRLFFGLKPKSATPDSASTIDDTTNQGKGKEINLFDTASLLKKHEVDVWHWDDPRIIPNQKKQWKDVKDQTYRAVYHVTSDRIVQLADLQMPFIIQSDNSDLVLGRSNLPYLKSITWEGTFSDFYIVSLKDGTRKLIVSRLDGGVSLSPTGRYAAYYKDKNWFLYNVREATTRNLTAKLGVPFHNEEYDKPDTPPGYGIEGWVENDRAVLLYDKYDLWQFPIDEGQPLNLTNGEGRKTGYSYRIEKTDSEAQFFTNGQTVLLTAYHNTKKHTAFYKCSIGRAGIERLLEEEKRFTFVAKAKHSDTYLFTRQSYTEFPDLWATDAEFHSPKKLSNVNPQIDEFAWGTAELIEWNSLDGIPLQGVLIKPGNCEPGKLYPVLVYFYELSSQRLYEFNQVVVNHRPCFPFYASNGYALFLPDVRYEIGRPGFSATKCIVPGVQKLIDMGIADPKAIALHGHSWSGYQTAFVITQTDIFAAAIAGAAVANMTSAYSGLRLETGLARQFQYEQDQSRIGGSLWELRDRYIENSPVFFADRIHTPLLLEAGDEDEAVPWQQSIEMYLAMRRLGKPCVLLQYRGEPHHLKKYPNKLDYSIKMKEYLDHYLKGMPAPEWISKGVPYREE
jgi:dipeptidyl aminopeptidase/acylaminoacyl peptidase